MDSGVFFGGAGRGAESLLLLKLNINSGASFAFKLFHSQGLFAPVID